MTAKDPRPLVMHVVYRFDVGGLENGVVNLINHLPETEFRHVLVALTDCAPAFCDRVVRDDVEFVSLRKPAGQTWRLFPRFWRLCDTYRPAIVHTRNLATLELQLPARAAGVAVRVHGEHGRDMTDPHGRSRKYQLLRRAVSPFVTHYVALSAELQHYLTHTVGVPRQRVTCIHNGVDERKFAPGGAPAATAADGRIVVGTVGRLDPVKSQITLVEAVDRVVAARPEWRDRLRVEVVGEGTMRMELEREVAARHLTDVVVFPGERHDVHEAMKSFDIFVLPSLAEGMSNTILEAMASGLPVVATAVGGNTELVREGRTGTIVEPAEPTAMAAAISRYLDDAKLRLEHGRNGRAEVEDNFSMSRMIERYRQLYLGALAERTLLDRGAAA